MAFLFGLSHIDRPYTSHGIENEGNNVSSCQILVSGSWCRPMYINVGASDSQNKEQFKSLREIFLDVFVLINIIKSAEFHSLATYFLSYRNVHNDITKPGIPGKLGQFWGGGSSPPIQ